MKGGGIGTVWQAGQKERDEWRNTEEQFSASQLIIKYTFICITSVGFLSCKALLYKYLYKQEGNWKQKCLMWYGASILGKGFT